MNIQDKRIPWDEHLSKYKIPTVLKETLLKPYFESLSYKEPIIDLGCGTGYFSEIIINKGRTIIGVDKNGDLPSAANFTFIKQDLLNFKSDTAFKTILLVNILSVEVSDYRNKIIKKVSELLAEDGIAYILKTSSKLFTTPTNSDLINFTKLAEDKVHLRVKLLDDNYIEFDDYIVPEDETRKQIADNSLEIIEEKEFRHPDMKMPVYVLYVVKK